MFTGEYEYKLDEKGRVPLPPRFRTYLRAGVVLTRGFENCVVGYTTAGFDEQAKKIAETRLGAAKKRRYKRFVFGNAFVMSLDGQGRVALPVKLRQYAGIESEESVVVVGSDNYFELWNRAALEAESAAGSAEVWDIEERMEN